MSAFSWRACLLPPALFLIFLICCAPDRVDELITQLKSEKISERIAAAKELGKLGDPRAVVPLIELLKVSNEEDGEPALEALDRFDKNNVAEKLIQAFDAADAGTKPRLVFLLGSVAGKEAFVFLKGLMKSKDFNVRSAAIWAMANSGDSNAVGLLLEAVSDEAVVTQADVMSTGDMAMSFISLYTDKAVEAAVSAIKGGNPQLRLNALRVTAKKRNYDIALPALVDFFSSNIPSIDQEAVTQALAALKDDTELMVSDEPSRIRNLIQNAAYRAVCEAALATETLEVVAWARPYFIAIGRDDAEGALIKSLGEFGFIGMASDFSKSGNANLANAGDEWLSGKKITGTPDWSGVTWGMYEELDDLEGEEIEGGIVGGLHELATDNLNYAPPSYEARGNPNYPETAKLARVSGRVIVKAFITKTGEVERIVVIRETPSGFDFGKAAVEYLSQCKWKPAMLNDQPIDSEFTVTLNFSLQ